MDNANLIPLSQAVETIKTAILQGQHEALKGTNRVQLAVYYGIGKYLSKNTRRFAYGTGALKAISEQLRKDMPGLRGFSETNLKNMRLFYEQWDFLDANSSVTTDESSNNQQSSVATDELQSPANQIDIYRVIAIPNITDFPIESFFSVPFSHHVEIYKKVHDLPARYYYIHRTAEEHLSVEELERLIKQQAYEHQDKAPNNFVQTLSNSSLARKAVMMFKDSYTLEFINTEEIGVREAIDVDERVVEQRIVENIKKFIMTFGNDFAFVGNQYHLEVHGVEHFPDLLFFNRELNALVVVELKTGEFKSSYLGQLMGYLSILDAKVKKPHENPSIGIVLCKSANKDYVQFVIKDYSKPMGVATYTTAADMPDNLRNALPDIEQLRNLLSEKEY
jgi:predicted nuclease of restriction endonuclease-like (RecB) superfamily